MKVNYKLCLENTVREGQHQVLIPSFPKAVFHKLDPESQGLWPEAWETLYTANNSEVELLDTITLLGSGSEQYKMIHVKFKEPISHIDEQSPEDSLYLETIWFNEVLCRKNSLIHNMLYQILDAKTEDQQLRILAENIIFSGLDSAIRKAAQDVAKI